MSQRLPPRDANAYKHALGHLLVVGGDYNMGGAPLLAAESALRCGAGMVTVLTRAAHRPAFLARRPEIMVADPDDADARQTLLAKARGLVIGPGLGVAAWGRELLQSCLAAGLPTVLDADGLTGFAELGLTASGPLIVTPHVAEAARLLDADVVRVQNDRPRAVRELAVRVRGVAVLKGAGTLIAAEDPAESGDPTLLGVCAHGNPGMASAGMGDVLSGVIGALLVQGMAPAAAAVSGTCLHSLAADHAAAALGQHSLLAADLLDFIPRILRDGDRSGR